MASSININSSATVVLAQRLENLHRSGLPVAVRQTLNAAAFDVKKTTMPKTSSAAFTNRIKNFFKSNSKTFAATGFDIQKMQASTGFVGTDQAIDDLVQQERGGTITSRGYIPMDAARVSKSPDKRVRTSDRLSKKKIIDSRKGTGSMKQRFVRAAIKAEETNSFVLGNHDVTNLYRVDEIIPIGIGRGGIHIKLTAIYSYKEGRKVRVKATRFMEKAAVETSTKMATDFNKFGKAQVERILKKNR